MKYLKNIICTVAILIVTVCCFVVVSAKNELPIYLEGIKEREIKSESLTDLYNVDILTKDSNITCNNIKENKAKQFDDLQKNIDLRSLTDTSIDKEILSASSELFQQKEIYNVKNEKDKASDSVNLIYGAIILSLSSIGFLGAIALKKKKEQKNVHNNNIRVKQQ